MRGSSRACPRGGRTTSTTTTSTSWSGRLPWNDPTATSPETRVDDPAVGVGPPSSRGRGRVADRLEPGHLPDARRVARSLGIGPDPGVATIAGAPAGEIESCDAMLTSAPPGRRDVRVPPRRGRVGGLRPELDLVRAPGPHPPRRVRSVAPEGWVELGRARRRPGGWRRRRRNALHRGRPTRSAARRGSSSRGMRGSRPAPVGRRSVVRVPR